MTKPVKILGIDLALNHMGIVLLEDAEMSNFWYVTSIAGSAAKSKEHGFRLRLPKTKEKQVLSVSRLAWLHSFIGQILYSVQPDYVGIEDYALRVEHGSHYMGEIGGITRLLCWQQGIKVRLHDPLSVKMFVAHDGTAQKDAVERAVAERWGVNFSKYNPPRAKPTTRNPSPKQNRTTSEDLADAYSVAKMVWTEVQLRYGRVLLSQLHPKEIQVFNRVTKTYPVSLLDRDWIVNPTLDCDLGVHSLRKLYE